MGSRVFGAFLSYMFVLVSSSGCVVLSEHRYATGECPVNMAKVYSPARNRDICVDRYEMSPKSSDSRWVRPFAHQSFFTCMEGCARRGKRMLWHSEWQAACSGTPAKRCNIYGAHPVLKKAASKTWRYKGVDCSKQNNTWGKECMNDPSLNQGKGVLAHNAAFSQCVSESGVANMIGNLGEWVLDVSWKKGRLMGRFNGGLYPQPRSSCGYTTIAHEAEYSDYSVGCRCAMDLPTDDRWQLAFAEPF